MNSLTLFLYLADIIGNLQVLFAWIGGLALVGFAVPIARVFLTNIDRSYDLLTYKKGLAFTTALIAIVAFTFCSLVPSKQTMYLMAGSEVGEMVVTSEEGKAVLSDIREAIRNLTSKEDKE